MFEIRVYECTLYIISTLPSSELPAPKLTSSRDFNKPGSTISCYDMQRLHSITSNSLIREIHLARSEKFICLKLKNPKSLPVRIALHPNSLVARLQQLQQPSSNTLMLPTLYSITLYHPSPRIQVSVSHESVMRKSKSNRKLLLFVSKTPTSPPLF